MTALDTYLRLEAVGLWRETPDADPREVVVSFGKTTLVLTDLAERPLGHWALAGVSVLGRDATGRTIYAMSADGGETLAIRDPDMVAAIAAVAHPVPEPRRRWRLPVGAFLLVAALSAAAVFGPRLLRTTAARLVPPEQAAEIGDRMLIGLIEAHGPPCDGAPGERALDKLAAALDPAAPPRLRVMALGRTPVAAPLPGGAVLIDRESAATAPPEALAGQVAGALAVDPVRALVTDAGMLADLRYVFSGHFGERTLARAAESAIARRSAAAPVAIPEMAASDWQALRGICR